MCVSVCGILMYIVVSLSYVFFVMDVIHCELLK